MNNRVLASLTKWCYRHGAFGNLLLTFIVPAWMFWPMTIPYYFSSYALILPALFLCGMLLRTGYRIVDRNWGNKVRDTCTHTQREREREKEKERDRELLTLLALIGYINGSQDRFGVSKNRDRSC